MRQTVQVNIGGRAFTVDREAYGALDDYLRGLRRRFRGTDDVESIMSDIESRISEHFWEWRGTTQQV